MSQIAAALHVSCNAVALLVDTAFPLGCLRPIVQLAQQEAAVVGGAAVAEIGASPCLPTSTTALHIPSLL